MCIHKGHRASFYVYVWLLGVRLGPSKSDIFPTCSVGRPDGERERERKIEDNSTERAAVAGATSMDRAAVAGARTYPPAEVPICVCLSVYLRHCVCLCLWSVLSDTHACMCDTQVLARADRHTHLDEYRKPTTRGITHTDKHTNTHKHTDTHTFNHHLCCKFVFSHTNARARSHRHKHLDKIRGGIIMLT